MRTEVQAAPAGEPVTLAEAKAHCRIEVSDDDALVTLLISAARDSVERFLNRRLITQTLKSSLDACDMGLQKRAITLDFPPVQSVTSVTGYLIDGTPVVLPGGSYRVSGWRIVLADNAQWPSYSREFDAVEIVYVVGYGASGSAVPEPIKAAIKMLVAHWYESREAAGDPVISEIKGHVIPFGVQQILSPFRIYAI